MGQCSPCDGFFHHEHPFVVCLQPLKDSACVPCKERHLCLFLTAGPNCVNFGCEA
jgi:hypothetical protein